MHTKHFVSDADARQPSTRAAGFTATLLLVLAVGCWAMLGLVRPAIAGRVPNRLSDAEVLGVYIQVNGFDIETALLARAQANSRDVRELAARVSSDHLGVRQGAFDLAAKCDVSPVLPAGRAAAAIEHGRAMTTLAALKGAEFDKEYLRHEVAFHRAAIDAVRQVLEPSATCPALKAHFKEIVPALEHHASETEKLARELTTR